MLRWHHGRYSQPKVPELCSALKQLSMAAKPGACGMVSTCARACDERVCWKVLAQGCWPQVSWGLLLPAVEDKHPGSCRATQEWLYQATPRSTKSPCPGVPLCWLWSTAPGRRGAGQWCFSRSPSQLLGTRWARGMSLRHPEKCSYLHGYTLHILGLLVVERFPYLT